ncbi:MAG: hypothetical protein QY331_06480 [Melioribacteraceae bacterium]|jgi:membrane protein implicated in regulation of membrane protease activity|nr:hypothetical protein [Melioribacteraceae bacterium]RJP59716.1 MAG: hypothetical protein C4543_06110 [Ignavibacteriales bacterium]WKZ70894.1 MAG: hypothetical protein QY331_06480 [Melioribacteraceae bacterium]
MESLTQKLKNSLNFTLVLGFLSLTWLIIDYFVIETILAEGLGKFSLEWILLVASGIAFIVFHISVFITIYYGYRVTMKFKSEMKKSGNNITKQLEQES